MSSKPVEHASPLLMVLLAAVVTTAPFSIDAYLPAFPSMAADLKTAESSIQATLAAFLFGLAMGPVFLGGLSDFIGRKPVLLTGLFGFMVTSAICAVASNVELLIVSRFFQAVFAVTSMSTGGALLADIYSGDELSRKASVIMVFMSIAPMIAPIIGGEISEAWGWRYIFWAIAMAAVPLLLLALKVAPETLPPSERSSFSPTQSFKGFAEVLRQPGTLQFLGMGFFVSAIFFSYVSATPFIYIEQLGMSETTYSYFFAAGAIVAVAANWLNIRSVGRVGYRKTLFWQGIITSVTGALLFLGIMDVLGLWAVYLAGVLFMGLMHVVSTNSTTGVMDASAHAKGAASALMMSSRFGGGVFGVFCISLFGGTEFLTYGIILLVFAVLVGLICLANPVKVETETD